MITRFLLDKEGNIDRIKIDNNNNADVEYWHKFFKLVPLKTTAKTTTYKVIGVKENEKRNS